MPSATLTWTALPNGLRRGTDDTWRARISIFVAMRLASDGGPTTLEDFQPLLDWPATLAGESGEGPNLTVYVSDGERADAGIPVAVQPGTSARDPDGWRAIFKRDMAVTTVEPPARTLMSYPATEVLSRVRKAYAQSVIPDPDLMQGSALEDFAAIAGAGASRLRSAEPSALAELADFLTAAGDPQPDRLGRQGNNLFEFHQVVSGIAGHPALMRRLGLVLDIELPADALNLDSIVPSRIPRIAVVPGGLSDPDRILQHESPWTAVEVGAAAGESYRTFCTAPDPERDATSETQPVHAGMRALPSGTNHVAQEHLEYAFSQLVQHASDLAKSPRGSEAQENAPPALLQVGMRMLDDTASDDMAAMIAAQHALSTRLRPTRLGAPTAATHKPPDDTPLYASDLTRGFRVDVRDDDGGTWRSLCRRSNRYAADGWAWPEDGAGVEDEGTVTPSVYEDKLAKKTLDQATLRVVPDLFTWDGWSLVVPHPDAGLPDPYPTAGQRAAAGPVSVDTVVPPGSLQPQRFGRSYRFRARSVDIAGNSLTPGEADAIADELEALSQQQSSTGPAPATSPVEFLRVENVPPPVVFPAQPRGPGEAGGDVIVVRDAESAAHRTRRFRLHVLPPRASLRTAERHGLFDALSPEASWALIEAHSGTLEEDGDGTQRDYIAAATLTAPYLPDPAARQAVMVLPGDETPRAVPLPRFDAVRRRAPDDALALACTLIVEAGNNDLGARVAGRSMILTVPKGRITHVRLATRLDEDVRHIMALANKAWKAPVTRETLTDAAESGGAPALAPSRTLEIVHATQRPLTAPVFVAPALIKRARNDTQAVLEDPQFLFDLPSSGRLDVYAQWEETIDDPARPAWRRTRNALHAGGQTLRPDDTQPFAPAAAASEDTEAGAATSADRPPTLQHDFGDTRHRRVTYHAVATSRFAAFYPPELTADPANITRAGPAITMHVPSTAPPDAPDVAYVVPTFERTSSRSPGGTRTATQRGFGLRVYLHRGWFSSGEGEQLALVLGPAGGSLPVSEWGTDPTIETAQLPGPIDAAHVVTDDTARRNITRSDQPLTLLLHEVTFGETQGLPFADITFRSQAAAMPLVRLALARYQPHSIEGCHHSDIVLADFVPLAPDRHLTVSVVSVGRWRIAAVGQGYRDSGGAPGVVEARIEQQPMSARADDAAWQAASDTVVLAGAVNSAFELSWQGELELLREARPGRWRRRLVLREFASPRPGEEPLEERSRLVSVQTVPL